MMLLCVVVPLEYGRSGPVWRYYGVCWVFGVVPICVDLGKVRASIRYVVENMDSRNADLWDVHNFSSIWINLAANDGPPRQTASKKF